MTFGFKVVEFTTDKGHQINSFILRYISFEQNFLEDITTCWQDITSQQRSLLANQPVVCGRPGLGPAAGRRPGLGPAAGHDEDDTGGDL